MGCATSSPEVTSSARDFAMVPATPDGPPRPHPADVETPAQRRRRLRAARPPPNSASPPHADLPGLKRLPPSAATAVSDDRPSTDSRRENSVATNSTGSRQVNAADPLGGLASAESSMDAIPMPQREERLPPAATVVAAVHAEVAQGSLNPLSDSSLVVTTAPSHNSVGVVPLATTDTSTSLTTKEKPPAATLGVSTTLGASRNRLRRFPGADTHLSSSSLSSSRRQQGAPPRQGAAATSSRQASSGRSFLLASSFFGHRSASHDAGGAQ